MTDQATFDLVRNIAIATCRFELLEFRGVSVVTIVSGTLTLDENSIETLPTTIEEKRFSAINCSKKKQDWKRKIHTETNRSISTEITQSISTTSEFKGGISLGGKGAKFNGDLATKNEFSYSTTERQSFSEKVENDFDESRVIDPRTALKINVRTIKGLVKGRVNGVVQVDAVIQAVIKLGPTILTGNWALSDSGMFRQEPSSRTAPIAGYIYAESYESTEIVYKEKPIRNDEKICDFTFAEGLPISFDQDQEIVFSDHEIWISPNPPQIQINAKKIEIRIHSDDVGDLFVWVWDLNSSTHKAVIDGERMNQDEEATISVVANGNGDGLISWKAVRTDDRRLNRYESDVDVSEGDRVDVTTRFGALARIAN